MAQRSLWSGAAGGENRIDQGAEGTDGVGSRIAGVADYDDLNRTQPPDIGREVEILEIPGDPCFQVLFQITVVNSRNGDLPDLWSLDLAPDLDLQLIARADDVVARNRHQVKRRKRARRQGKQRLSEQRQRTAHRISD